MFAIEIYDSARLDSTTGLKEGVLVNEEIKLRQRTIDEGLRPARVNGHSLWSTHVRGPKGNACAHVDELTSAHYLEGRTVAFHGCASIGARKACFNHGCFAIDRQCPSGCDVSGFLHRVNGSLERGNGLEILNAIGLLCLSRGATRGDQRAGDHEDNRAKSFTSHSQILHKTL